MLLSSLCKLSEQVSAGGEGCSLGLRWVLFSPALFLNIREKQNSWYLELLPKLPILLPVLEAARCGFASRLQQQ